ncbi:MAG: helix-hairpin-helix domain-containing protein [Pirellulales bacterium]|nr:helix-hairpin-helix domain-containing protein [Pirellulales bacterium]
MITSITGVISAVGEEKVTLAIGPIHCEIMVPDFVRRKLQTSVNESVSLYTLLYIEGNPQGRMNPKMVGFTSEAEREFFELFCSVGGVGPKKALRAMVRPVKDIATMIEQQDKKALSTLPGIGAKTGELIIANLRTKMPKFALLATTEQAEQGGQVAGNIVEETFQVLVSLGHSELHARQLIENLVANGEAFDDVEAMIQAIYYSNQ